MISPEREYDLDVVRRLGYSGAVPPLYVSLKAPDSIAPDGPYVCLCPGGKTLPIWRHKRWPYYPDLIEMLLAKDAGIRIFILGTADDVLEKADVWGERVRDMRGKLTLRQTAWLLKHSAVAIGNDCGPMHIADAVLTPSVVIFGPTCEVKNGPRNRGRVACAEMSSRPCQ